MDEKKFPLGKAIACALRPLRAGGRSLLSFAGVEEGRLRPRAAVLGALLAALAIGALVLRGGPSAQADFASPSSVTIGFDTDLSNGVGIGENPGGTASNPPASVAPGTLDLIIAIDNDGGAMPAGVHVVYTVAPSGVLQVVPNSARFINPANGSTTGGTCTTSGNTIDCTSQGIGADAGDASDEAYIAVQVRVLDVCGGTAIEAGMSTAIVVDDLGDSSDNVNAPAATLDTASIPDNVANECILKNVTASATSIPSGGTVTFTATLTNNGNAATGPFTVTMDVTGGTAMTVSCSVGTATIVDADTVQCTGVNLAPAQTLTMTVQVQHDGVSAGGVTATVSMSPPQVEQTGSVNVRNVSLITPPQPAPPAGTEDHWNVIGSDHEVCALAGTDLTASSVVRNVDGISNQFGANAVWTGAWRILLNRAPSGNDDYACVTIRSTTPGETTHLNIHIDIDGDGDVDRTVGVDLIKEWSKLVDSAVLNVLTLPRPITSSQLNDVGFQHANSIEGQTISWRVDAPLYILEVSHGEHETHAGTVHVPVDGAVVRVEVSSPRGCTTATPATGTSGPVSLGAFGLPDLEHGGHLFVLRATCEEVATITIVEDYPNPVSSVFQPVRQTFRVNWVTHEVAKQPLIRKAGEKVVLETVAGTWDDDFEACVDRDERGRVVRLYDRVEWVMSQDSPGQLIAQESDETQNGNDHVIDFGPDFVDEKGRCVWDVMAHSEDPGQMDVEALIFVRDVKLPAPGQGEPEIGDPYMLEQRPFVVWFVKLYSVTTTFVPGTLYERIVDGTPTGVGFDRNGDGVVTPDEGVWAPEPAVFASDRTGGLPAGDQRFESRIVSDHALVRVQVKDYIYLANRSGRPDTCLDMDGDGDGSAGAAPGPYPTTTHAGCPDLDDEAIAGGYWVLPDDFTRLAGFLPSLMRAEWDSLFGPTDPDASGAVGRSLIGPKRPVEHELGFAFYDYAEGQETFDSIAPNSELPGDPQVLVNIWDAQMPLEKVTLAIPSAAQARGFHSGLLVAVDKDVVYRSGTNPYYQVNIPANDDIPVTDTGGGYDWDSVAEGPYPFWHPLQWLPQDVDGDGRIDRHTGRIMQLYTDNRGEAMALVLGDYALTFTECARNPVTGAPECSRGDRVGATAVVATVDYPYHRGKHRDMRAAPAVETWTWGGYKSGVDAGDPDLPAALRRPEIVPTDNPSFKYLVVHLKDRDGRCDNLWPGQIDPAPGRNGVRNEPIDFLVDSAVGRIVDSALDGTISADGKSAIGVRTGRVFSSPSVVDDFDAAGERHFAPFEEGECQAWVLIQNSTNEPANVSIRYHDPEGDIVIDVLVPGVGTEMVWGDVDCDRDVDATDALKVLRYVAGLSVLQTEPCPDIGSTVTVDGVARRWGDVDGNGAVNAVDALKILRHVAGLSVSQAPGTPAIGSTVRVS